MSNQAIIQTRAVDPLVFAKASVVNFKQKAIIGNKTKGVLYGYDVLTILDGTKIKVTKGVCIKDLVTITYKEDVILDVTGYNDGFYFVVLEYEYPTDIDNMTTPPTAEIKIVTILDYQTNEAKYLFLSELRVDSGNISYISKTATNGVVNVSVDYIIFGDHASLSGIQGGAPNEYYHLTQNEYTALSSIVANPVNSHSQLSNIQGGEYHLNEAEYLALYYLSQGDLTNYHNTSVGNGIDINTERLSGLSVSDISFANHIHMHATLNNIQGSTEGYHLSAYYYDKLDELVNTLTNARNVSTISGYKADDLARVDHNHDHSNLLNVQGGSYHLNQNEIDAVRNILNNSSVSNVCKLNGYVASDFALANHNHSHMNVLEKQGSGEYHFTQNEYTCFQHLMNTQSVNNVQCLGGHPSSYFANIYHTHNHDRLINTLGNGKYHVNQIIHAALTNALEPSSNNYFLTESEFNQLFSGRTNSYNHNDVVNIQGGLINQYYHLSLYEYNQLINNQDNTIHHHDNSYPNKSNMDYRYINITGDSLQGTLNLNGNTIINIQNPNPTSNDNAHVYALIDKAFVDQHLAESLYHNKVGNIQGLDTLTNSAYHLNNSELEKLVGGTSTILHNHNNRYYKKTEFNYLTKTGGFLTGNINFNSANFKNIADVSNDTDLVNKKSFLDLVANEGQPNQLFFYKDIPSSTPLSLNKNYVEQNGVIKEIKPIGQGHYNLTNTSVTANIKNAKSYPPVEFINTDKMYVFTDPFLSTRPLGYNPAIDSLKIISQGVIRIINNGEYNYYLFYGYIVIDSVYDIVKKTGTVITELGHELGDNFSKHTTIELANIILLSNPLQIQDQILILTYNFDTNKTQLAKFSKNGPIDFNNMDTTDLTGLSYSIEYFKNYTHRVHLMRRDLSLYRHSLIHNDKYGDYEGNLNSLSDATEPDGGMVSYAPLNYDNIILDIIKYENVILSGYGHPDLNRYSISITTLKITMEPTSFNAVRLASVTYPYSWVNDENINNVFLFNATLEKAQYGFITDSSVYLLQAQKTISYRRQFNLSESLNNFQGFSNISTSLNQYQLFYDFYINAEIGDYNTQTNKRTLSVKAGIIDTLNPINNTAKVISFNLIDGDITHTSSIDPININKNMRISYFMRDKGHYYLFILSLVGYHDPSLGNAFCVPIIKLTVNATNIGPFPRHTLIDMGLKVPIRKSVDFNEFTELYIDKV